MSESPEEASSPSRSSSYLSTPLDPAVPAAAPRISSMIPFQAAPLKMHQSDLRNQTITRNIEATRKENQQEAAPASWLPMLSLSNPWRRLWDLLIMVIVSYNCFYIPVAVVFKPEIVYEWYLILTDSLIDIIYAMDVLVSFRITYIDSKTGDEVSNPKKVIQHYLRSGAFAVDLLAALPIEMLDYASTGRDNGWMLLKLAKTIRLFGLSKVLMFWKTTESIKLLVKLAGMLSLLAMYIHLEACFWFMLIKQREMYVPPSEFLNEHGHHALYDADVFKQYSISLYTSIFMLICAEIGPQTEWELLYASNMIIFGQIVQAILFGEMTVVMSNLSRKSIKMDNIQDSVNTAMMNMKLSKELRIKVNDFLIASHGSLDRQSEFEQFFKILSPSLEREVNAFIYKPIAEQNVLLGGNQDLADFVLHHLSNLFCQPEQEVVTQGDEPRALYFVANGKCEVEILNEHKQSHRVKVLEKGQHFGEVALIYHTIRTATVRTLTYASIASLDKEDFGTMLKKFPDVGTSLKQVSAKYKDSWKKFLKTTLSRCSYFSNLSSKHMDDLIYSLPTERFSPNDHLFDLDQTVTKAYFLLEGKVETYLTTADAKLGKVKMAQEEPAAGRQKVQSDSDISRWQSFQMRPSNRRITVKRKGHIGVTMEKLPLDELSMGSVLCAELLLVGGKTAFTCKAVESTTVLTLTTELLEKICKRNNAIKQEVEKKRKSLIKIDSLSRQPVLAAPILDYEKSFKYEPTSAVPELWETRKKIKSLVVRKLTNKRESRKRGVPDMHTMVLKMKAIIVAEESGNYELAKQIANGQVSPEAIHAFDLLTSTEIQNPLLTQFALKAKEVESVMSLIHKHYVDMGSRCAESMKESADLESQVKEMKQVLRSVGLRIGSQ